LVLLLGLDFAVAALFPADNRLLLGRGPLGRATLFFQPGARYLKISASLWDSSTPVPIHPEHFSDFLANNLLPAPIDCNHTVQAAAAGWLRVPRAAVLTVDMQGAIVRRDNFALPSLPGLDAVPTEVLEDRLRDAVDEHLTDVVGADPATCEVSGGIDSGIVAARARRLLGERLLAGISLISPYPELRREADFIEAVAQSCALPLRAVDLSESLPFRNLDQVPMHDEPNLTAIPWCLLEESLKASRHYGACVHLHGIGGDQMFLDPPGSFSALETCRRSFLFLEAHARRKVVRSVAAVRRHYFGRSGPSYFDRGLLIYDGWTDRYLAPRMGLRYEPGLVSWKILRLAEALRRRAGYPQDIAKPLPRVVFAADLPESVRIRRGKVGFDGVYQRGLRLHLGDVVALVERSASHLESYGARPDAVVRGIRRLASLGWNSQDTPLIAVVAWLSWKESLERKGVLAGN
jgi:asparagine synthetase B (glutamine-hydrolysing)